MATAKSLLVLILSATLGACATQTPADAAIAAAVKKRIAATPALAIDNLTVQVRDGVVYLDGLADTPGEQAQAEYIAHEVPGVKKVIDMTGLRSNLF